MGVIQGARGDYVTPSPGGGSGPQHPQPPGGGPTSLPGIVSWYRSDLGVTQSAGTITAWADQVDGNGLGLGVAPIYNTSDASWNNRPSIGFSGTQYLVAGSSNPNLSQPTTIYVACTLTSSAATQAIFDGTSNRELLFWDGLHWNIGSAVSTSANRAVSVFACIFNGASSALYQNSSASNLISSTAGTLGLTGVRVGASPGPANFCTGSMVEFAIYNQAHSAATVGQFFRYAGGLYGQSWS